jgi:hypothetical protein
MNRELIEGEAARPIASITGYHSGHCVIEPIDRAQLLPVGMALYLGAQAAQIRREQISRSEIIDVLTATTGLSEGVTADAILAAMRSEK